MLDKPHIRYFMIKFAIFLVLAVLVLIFREQQVEHLQPFIGSLMIFYGVEGIFYEAFFHKLKFIRVNKTYLGLIELILGIVVIVAPLEFAYVCIIWATWSIIRESYELKELITDIKTWPPRIISGAESIAVIVFSILLIFEPGEHHALIHMGLLVVELILNPFTVLLDEILIHFKEKKQAKLKEKEKDQ